MANCFCPGWPEEEEEGRLLVNGGAASIDEAPWSFTNESTTAATPFHFYGYPCMGLEGVGEDRAASASKSHSQAEKRRRDRINTQLSALRKLIPMSDRMDKAALLESVVEHVKDLKRKTNELTNRSTIPTDADEVTIDFDFDFDSDQSPTTTTTAATSENSKGCIFIRASLSCDDRPEIFVELSHALQGLKLATVEAEIISLGGRIRSNFVLSTKNGEEGVCLSSLKQSLKAVFSRIATSSSTSSNYRVKSRRQRFFLPSNYSQSSS